MKQIITLAGLRRGFLFIAAPVARSFRCIRVLAPLFLLALVSNGSMAQSLIDTFISGPTEVCLDQSITYRPGPDTCTNVYWKIVYNDTQLALAATKIICDDPLTTNKEEY